MEKDSVFPAPEHSPAQAGDSVLRVLCLGDVVGRPGRRVLQERLPGLRAAHGLDLIIANGENASGGIGLTPDTLRELLRAGVDVVTSGNHIWKHKEIHPVLGRVSSVLRPENYGSGTPGRGWGVFALARGFRVGVLNLQGRVFMEPLECPFAAADAALAAMGEAGAEACIVDFHAEASSEKRALMHYLDGRAALVFGTHTHVQTADAHVTGKGTACVTDIGMCGVEFDSVIGMGREAVLKRFLTGLPQRFSPARGEASLNGILAEIDKKSGKALSIRLLRDKPAAIL